MTHVDTRLLALRARDAIGAVDASEVAFALLLASVFWLPPLAGGKAWPVALAVLLALAAHRLVRQRRTPTVPLFLVVFIVGYAVAALYGGSLTAADVAHHFVRPLIAVGVASLAVLPAQRLRALALIVLLSLSEVLVTGLQVFENIVRYGRHASIAADAVTGSFGASQAGTVGLIGLAGACIVAAAWFGGVLRLRIAVPLAVALLAIPVFSATRAAVFAVVLLGLATVLAGLAARPRPTLSRLAGFLAISVVLSPALYGATRAIYPDAFTGMISSQELTALGGPRAFGIRTPSPPAGAGSAQPAAPTGVQLLPGRAGQLKTAYHLSFADGGWKALLGRGLGSSSLDPRWRLAQDVPRAERTGSTWVGLILTETGWLGLALFCGLLAWLVLTGRRLWQDASNTADRALAAALPGIAALTAFGAVLTTILQVRCYSIVFWMLVGLAISARGEDSARPARRPSTTPLRT